uniref:Uncharacterized protein n=1 Tax=Anguilla anguilla TaxID=7936 RepID=A0A0E9R6R3_ANGAN
MYYLPFVILWLLILLCQVLGIFSKN